MPSNVLQGMKNNIGSTFSVGDTSMWVLYNLYWARQIELVTLDTIFGVVG